METQLNSLKVEKNGEEVFRIDTEGRIFVGDKEMGINKEIADFIWNRYSADAPKIMEGVREISAIRISA